MHHITSRHTRTPMTALLDLFNSHEFNKKCVQSISEGYITEEIAESLIKEMNKNPWLAKQYPNNVLLHLLEVYITSQEETLKSDAEHDICILIDNLYSESSFGEIDYLGLKLQNAIAKLKREFCNQDTPDQIDLNGKTVKFTGSFKSSARGECFEASKKLNATPIEQGGEVDYLFIADESTNSGIISSKTASALTSRKKTGKPRIYSESTFLEVLRHNNIPIGDYNIKHPARKSKKVEDPGSYFANWAFVIDQPRWATLGLTQRTFIKNKKPFLAWAIDSIPNYGFSEGYTYYKKHPSKEFILIAADFGDGTYEVHTAEVGAKTDTRSYKLSGTMIETWLRTGNEPTDATRLRRGEGKSGVYTWMAKNKD